MRLQYNFSAGTLHKLSFLAVLILFISFLVPVGLPLINLYSSYTDDFYYYLKIADSFTHGQGLCYSPHVYTNGFQPFFQFFIVVLVYIARLFGAPELIFIRIVLALVFAGFSLFLLRKLQPRGLAATLFFILGLFGYYFISCQGMESLFIVPVLTYFAFRLSTGGISINRAAVLVVLAFFMRIDSFIITLPLFFYYLAVNTAGQQDRMRTIITSGLIMGVPVALYLGANYIAYHSLFPVSGLAKSVVKIGGINGAGLDSFAFYFPYNIYNVTVTGLFILVALTGNFKDKIYFHLLALTTVLFYLQTAVRSDWELWAWYFYPIPPLAFMMAAKGRGLFAGTRLRFNRLIYMLASGFAGMMVLVSVVLWVFYTFPIHQSSSMGRGKVDILHIAGVHINAFEAQHKGVYAMGDRAGIVGYLMQSPLIQLEGLVMDKEYMNRLSKAKKLRPLLNAYKVDYYIASNPVQLNDSLYIVREPAQSRGRSHQVTDTINWKVCHSFTLAATGVFSGKVNDRFRTVIFEVPK